MSNSPRPDINVQNVSDLVASPSACPSASPPCPCPLSPAARPAHLEAAAAAPSGSESPTRSTTVMTVESQETLLGTSSEIMCTTVTVSSELCSHSTVSSQTNDSHIHTPSSTLTCENDVSASSSSTFSLSTSNSVFIPSFQAVRHPSQKPQNSNSNQQNSSNSSNGVSSSQSRTPLHQDTPEEGSSRMEIIRTPSPQPSGSGRANLRRRRSRQRTEILRAYSEQVGAVPVRGESFCQCKQQSHSRDLTCSCGEEDSVFEWTWEQDTKSAACVLSNSGREVKFHVNYSSGTAAVRGSQPMADRQYFWEVKMTTPVYGTDMMVGVGTQNVDLNACRYNFCSLLGRDSDSWGLSYYGRAQHKGEFLHMNGSRFGQGSIVGVHLDMWRGIIYFYKNRRPLGAAYSGLASKVVHPMVSSTAARTGMRLIKSCSFPTSLQFLCCKVLRSIIPGHMNVIDALKLPPGLEAFLANNLSWLLRPSELQQEAKAVYKSRYRKRRQPSPPESNSEQSGMQSDSSSCDSPARKRLRRRHVSDAHSDLSSVSEDSESTAEVLHENAVRSRDGAASPWPNSP